MSRRPIVGACVLCTLVIVVAGCSDSSKGTNTTSADKPAATSASTPATSKNVKTGNGTPTTMTTGVASRTLRPVGVGVPAELARQPLRECHAGRVDDVDGGSAGRDVRAGRVRHGNGAKRYGRGKST